MTSDDDRAPGMVVRAHTVCFDPDTVARPPAHAYIVSTSCRIQTDGRRSRFVLDATWELVQSARSCRVQRLNGIGGEPVKMVATRKSGRFGISKKERKKTLAKHITIESCCKRNIKTRIVADTINCYCICNGKHGKSTRYSAETTGQEKYMNIEWKTDHMIGLAVQSIRYSRCGNLDSLLHHACMNDEYSADWYLQSSDL